VSTKKKQEADVVEKEPQQLHKKDVVVVDLTNSGDDKEDEPNENGTTSGSWEKSHNETLRPKIQLEQKKRKRRMTARLRMKSPLQKK
jgi:hypothetical protein